MAKDITRRTRENTSCVWTDESPCSSLADCPSPRCTHVLSSCAWQDTARRTRFSIIITITSPGQRNILSTSSNPDGKWSDRQLTRITDKVEMCTVHDGQTLSLFCVPCDIVVCSHCASVEKHKEHQPRRTVEGHGRRKEGVLGKGRRSREGVPPSCPGLLLARLKAVNDVEE